MQVRQTRLTTLSSESLAALAEIEPNLVIVFAAPEYFADPGFAASLAQAFPKARRVGASTAGEIAVQGVSEHKAVITAVRLEKITFRVAATELAGMDDSRGAGARIAEQLVAPDLKAVILLSQGVGVNGSELIAGATGTLGGDIPLTGGLAGDYGAFTRTWTLLDDQVSSSLMLGIGLYGDAVRFAHGSFGGWQSFGPAREATRARGNVLYELDGRPALDIYKSYLGDYSKDLPASGLLFPFALLADNQHESGLIRTLLGVNESDGSLVLAGDIPEGGYVRLMHASTESLVDGAESAARAAQGMFANDSPSLAILVSCIGRRLIMGDRVDDEVEAVGAVFGRGCVLTGFYSNGEISPYLDTTECKLHNQTMTITTLAEA